MNYHFSVKEKQGYLHVRVVGDNTPANVCKWVADGLEACARLKCSRVLVEENLAGKSLSILDTYSIVTEACKTAWPTVTQIAYVDTNPEHDKATLSFAETVALNRGANLKLFPNVEEAEKWLAVTSFSS